MPCLASILCGARGGRYSPTGESDAVRCVAGSEPRRYDPPLVTRPWLSLPLIALLLLALGASGCGGDDSEEKAASTTEEAGDRSEAPPTATEAGERRKAPRPPKERDDARREAAEKKQQARELEQAKRDDRKFDEAFEETPFERAIQRLPIRKPPLYVEQYITEQGRDTVYTAVDEKRFCKMTAAQRTKAVASFYRDARRSLRRAGVKGFAQVVTPLAETTEKLPALATARAGKVSLSRRGRNC